MSLSRASQKSLQHLNSTLCKSWQSTDCWVTTWSGDPSLRTINLDISLVSGDTRAAAQVGTRKWLSFETLFYYFTGENFLATNVPWEAGSRVPFILSSSSWNLTKHQVSGSGAGNADRSEHSFSDGQKLWNCKSLDIASHFCTVWISTLIGMNYTIK